VPMGRGFIYRTAVIDWFSRYVMVWRLSNMLDGRFSSRPSGPADGVHFRQKNQPIALNIKVRRCRYNR
jgi:hypothetical protein